ncbi:hypothetical protein EYF80_052036 [Liparis tanakae]|uniref:Uncharacterized protein n=1 Tax=Liparis tanakae TaxID=230148 RepID=A0A4Z2FAH5_9TELE|nr:hypothetical protein EYF80_052036 [Liparis tanakae]
MDSTVGVTTPNTTPSFRAVALLSLERRPPRPSCAPPRGDSSLFVGLLLLTIPAPLIETNVRHGSAENEPGAWISAYKENTAGDGTGSTRIASRTRHPVPRCLPPTSAGADEETV